MSFRRRPTEFEVQQTIALGAQISSSPRGSEFRDWAMMEPDMAFVIWLLEHPTASFIDILKVNAKLEFLKGTTEVTKLAMIVGNDEDIADLSKQAKRDNATS